jgi:hypothetical protein
MMMKGNGGTGETIEGNPKQITSSSSSSSSLPVDEHQQMKSRRYNFVPVPFNGTRLMAKSTEQLNRSFASDSLVNPPTPTSILKHKYTPSATIQSSSKTMHASRMIGTLILIRLTLHVDNNNHNNFHFIIIINIVHEKRSSLNK